jgi:predicted membrane GTPase involved in stress response
VFAAAKEGWAISDLQNKREGVKDLLDVIAKHVPHPDVDIEDDVRMLIT